MKTIALLLLFASCSPKPQPPEQKDGMEYMVIEQDRYLSDTIGINDTIKH